MTSIKLGSNTVSIDESNSRYDVVLTGDFKREIRIVCSNMERASKSFMDVVNLFTHELRSIPVTISGSDDTHEPIEIEVPYYLRPGVLDLETGTLTYFVED